MFPPIEASIDSARQITFKALMPRKGLEKGWFLRKKAALYLQIIKLVFLLKNFWRQAGIFFEKG